MSTLKSGKSPADRRQPLRGWFISLRKPCRRFWVRLLTFLLAFLFIFPPISWTLDPGNYAAANHGLVFNQQPVTIPRALGSISSTFQGDNRLVICIQDLHCNFEVQQNIAGLIDHLVRRYGLGLVGVEGAQGTINVSKLATFPVPAVRKAVGRYFLQEGRINGPEYYTAVLNPAIALEGMEVDRDYQTSLQCVRQFLNSESLGLIWDLRQALERLRVNLRSNPDKQAVDEQLRRLNIVEHILCISALPGEVAEYRHHPEFFQANAFMAFLQPRSSEAEIFLDDCFRLNTYLPAALEFYRFADRRSRNFARNILQNMARRRTRLAVLVTGGYHSNEILNQLQQEGVSCLMVKPRLTHPRVDNPYFSLLMGRKTALDKLLTNRQTLLGLPLNFPSESRLDPNQVADFREKLDLTLKEALPASLDASGRMTLAQLQAAWIQIIAKYPENDPKIKIAWKRAHSNEARGIFLLPFDDLGVTALIRPASAAPAKHVTIYCGKFEAFLLPNEMAQANQAEYLARNLPAEVKWLLAHIRAKVRQGAVSLARRSSRTEEAVVAWARAAGRNVISQEGTLFEIPFLNRTPGSQPVSWLGAVFLLKNFLMLSLVLGVVYFAWKIYRILTQSFLITLDGSDQAGKREIGIALSRQYGCGFVDVALIYRALALKVLQKKLNIDSRQIFETLRKTNLQFGTVNYKTGRQKILMDGKDISEMVGPTIRGRDSIELQIIASQLGRIPQLEQQVKRRLLQMAGRGILVVVGQNTGNLLGRRVRAKFYVVGDLKARTEHLLKMNLTHPPTQMDLTHAVEAIKRNGKREQSAGTVTDTPYADAVLIDTTRMERGEAISKASSILVERSSRWYPVREWWQRTFRQVPRMLDRAEGEVVKRQWFKSRKALWVVKSDVDYLKVLNRIYRKPLINLVLADINRFRLEGLRQPGIRRLTKSAVSILDSGDEATALLNGNLTPVQVRRIADTMRRWVRDQFRNGYRILDLDGFSDTPQNRAALEAICSQMNTERPFMLRAVIDSINGTQLLWRLGDVKYIPKAQLADLKKRVKQAGLGQLALLDLTPEVHKRMSPEALARLRPDDLEALAGGALWPSPTISVGFAKSTRAFPPKQMNELQQKRRQLHLTRAAVIRWIDVTEKMASDFLHQAKQVPGKNAVAGDDLRSPLPSKASSTGPSILDSNLKDLIMSELQKYEDNRLLKDNQGYPLYDGLVSWALSNAGLRQSVTETLEVLQKQPTFDPQVFVARAPSSIGPDKIQIVVVMPDQTYMVELEGRYYGHFVKPALKSLMDLTNGKDGGSSGEKLLKAGMLPKVRAAMAGYQVAEENGRRFYNFSILNNLVHYTAGDEMILAPQFILNDPAWKAPFLQKIQAQGGGPGAAVAFLITFLEKRANSDYNNSVKISPTAVWSSMPTRQVREQGLGALFRETEIANLVSQERMEGYSDAMLGKARVMLQERSVQALIEKLQTFSTLPETPAEPAPKSLALLRRITLGLRSPAAMSMASAALSLGVWGSVAAFAGEWKLCAAAGIIYGAQLWLIIHTYHRYQAEQGSRAVSLWAWIRATGGMAANVHGGWNPDLVPYANEFTRTWFNLHETAEQWVARVLRFEEIRWLGPALNHLTASLSDALTALVAAARLLKQRIFVQKKRHRLLHRRQRRSLWQSA